MKSVMKVDIYTSIITYYGRDYERALKISGHTQGEIERLLNEWIIDKLKFVKNNPKVNKEDLINYIEYCNEERKLR